MHVAPQRVVQPILQPASARVGRANRPVEILDLSEALLPAGRSIFLVRHDPHNNRPAYSSSRDRSVRDGYFPERLRVTPASSAAFPKCWQALDMPWPFRVSIAMLLVREIRPARPASRRGRRYEKLELTPAPGAGVQRRTADRREALHLTMRWHDRRPP